MMPLDEHVKAVITEHLHGYYPLLTNQWIKFYEELPKRLGMPVPEFVQDENKCVDEWTKCKMCPDGDEYYAIIYIPKTDGTGKIPICVHCALFYYDVKSCQPRKDDKTEP